jgi:ABC-type oligopeptide transport system ATPase subunit
VTKGEVVLEAVNVTKTYSMRSRRHIAIKALENVSVAIHARDALGIVGESGSGKTTLSKLLLGIERPTSGEVRYRGVSLPDLKREDRRRYRHAITAVFQNPYSSLDPRMRIWELITEQLFIERVGTTSERRMRAGDLLQKVGLNTEVAERYPHQLSGGQRQRVAIARALVFGSEVVVLDEAISALDVSVRAQIVNLLLELQESLDIGYVFIAHDLAIIQHICDRTIVIYGGKIVEEGATADIFAKPDHPYTAALIEASFVGEAHF